MLNQNEEVNQFIKKLEHPLKEAIEKVRTIILDSDNQITERIKWNAPSFCYKGEDRVTFKLYPSNRTQLVFHRGVKVRDSKNFLFKDSTGLLEWVSGDRAVVTFHDMKDVEAKEAALVKVVSQWMRSTE